MMMAMMKMVLKMDGEILIYENETSKHEYYLVQFVFPELTYNMSNNQDMWKNRALPLDVLPNFDGGGVMFPLILPRQICG